MSHRSHATLQNFFIFNPTYGKYEDEEEKKLIYFYPEECTVDEKLRDIGTSQALINFTKLFKPSKACEALYTQKIRQVYLEAEPDFWIVMSINLPSQQRTRDSQTVVEFLSEDVQDQILQSVLQMMYNLFKTFEFTFTDIVAKMGVAALREKLSVYFNNHLGQIKLQHCDILDIFKGIHFLALDKHAFLQVHSFANDLETTFPQVRYCAFLCNDQLVWSGLDQKDIQLLYHYLLSTVLQGVFEAELLNPTHSPSKNAVHARYLHGKTSDESFLTTIPHMFIDGTRYNLLLYRAYSATLCILLRPEDLTLDLAKQLEEFLRPEMTNLGNEILKQNTKLTSSSSRVSQEVICKYIYFNRMNIAQKSSVHSERKTGFQVPSSIMRLLTDLHGDLIQFPLLGTPYRGISGNVEIVAKTSEDWWVVAKSWDGREFYVILNHKNANLIQISDEVKKLCATQLQNIFFID